MFYCFRITLLVDTSKINATTSLARFLRDHLRLTGTKISCNQAGCGACVVTARILDPAQGIKIARSVNSVRIYKADFLELILVYEICS